MGERPADGNGGLPTEAGPTDPDAIWKPSGSVALADGDAPPTRRSPPPSHGSVSPWSREAIESPLPSIEAIRQRWRTELGLDDAERLDGVRRGSTGAVDTSRVVQGSTTTGDVVLAGVLVGVAVVLALVAAWFVRLSGGAPPDRMPAGVSPWWSVGVPSSVRPGDVAVGDDAVAVIAGDLLVVRSLDDGRERWRQYRPAGFDHDVAIHADAVVAIGDGPSGGEIAVFDVATGDVRWERSPSPDSRFEFVHTGVIEHVGRSAEVVARVLDLRSGLPLGPSVSITIGRTADAIIGQVGDDLAVLDLATGQVVQPAVAPFGLRAIAPVGDAVVGLTELNHVVLYGIDGQVVDERPFVSDAFGDFTGRAELFGGVPGTTIGIVASGTSIGFDVGDGRIEQRWEIDGRVFSLAETSIGPLGLARLVDPDDGEISIGVVDLVDGSTVAVTDAGGDREGQAVLFHDGYVVPPAVGDPDRTVEAFDYSGVERWSLDLPAGGWYVVDAGALVFVGDGELTVHR